MTSTKTIARIALTLLCLALLTSASLAATNPLANPLGMAVDAKGNLWVANGGGENILVFSPGYALQKKDTITQGVSEPTGVAFDSLGNLWVSNYTGTVTEYTDGVLDPNATIETPGQTEAIAIDGLNNVWVADNIYGVGEQSLAVYAPSQVYGPGNDQLMMFGPYPSSFYGIGVSGGELIWGDGNELNFAPATVAIFTGSVTGTSIPGSNATYLASAANGTIYFATTGNAVNYTVPTQPGIAYPFVDLSFAPTGIAVDSVRGRVYISNGSGNSISVYSLTGTLLHTIE
ncbi:MAG: hypothetical protein WCF68_03215 [Terriglobales bacterium]